MTTWNVWDAAEQEVRGVSLAGTAWNVWDANDQTIPYHRPSIRVPPVAGQRHRVTSILVGITTKTPMTGAQVFVVRDGESGVGPVLWAGAVACHVAGDGDIITAAFGEGNPVFGSVGAAMTVELLDVLMVSGTFDYAVISATGVTTTEAPPSNLWRLAAYGSQIEATVAGVPGKRHAATHVQYYLRHPPCLAGDEVTLGCNLSALDGNRKVLWASYNPRPSAGWGKRSIDMTFPSPLCAEVGGPFTAHSDTAEVGGLAAFNVWGRTMDPGGAL